MLEQHVHGVLQAFERSHRQQAIETERKLIAASQAACGVDASEHGVQLRTEVRGRDTLAAAYRAAGHALATPSKGRRARQNRKALRRETTNSRSFRCNRARRSAPRRRALNTGSVQSRSIASSPRAGERELAMFESTTTARSMRWFCSI